MDSNTREKIEELLSDPLRLKMKKPFYRGIKDRRVSSSFIQNKAEINEMVEAELPDIEYKIVRQSEYMKELDPMSHKVLFDDNIPVITMKTKDGGYVEVEYKRMTIPYQRLIRDKHVLHLCGNPMQFTLMNTDPDDKQMDNFITFKQYWTLRNMDGLRTKMVSAQKSFGDAGLLFYFDRNGQIKARLLSYEDGFVLCPHNDDNGDRILESVYYKKGDAEYIDSYDDENVYRYVCEWGEDSVDSGTWKMLPPKKHGFSEIPLITKRGKVAWDSVQNLIEIYEVIYNVFMVIQKRHGWGILFIKGNFKDTGKRIAGSVILNDTTLDGNGSAEFKQAPSPQNMIETLDKLEESIQKGSGTTIILPKDVKSSGDVSALAIMLTQSLDIETSLQGVIDWQNVADKMVRLFKEGLSKELVRTNKNPTAVTDYEDLAINAKFKIWRPQNDYEYNNMLISLKSAGLISEETGIENNTESSPDEKVRRRKEREEAMAMANNVNTNDSNNNINNTNMNREGGDNN